MKDKIAQLEELLKKHTSGEVPPAIMARLRLAVKHEISSSCLAIAYALATGWYDQWHVETGRNTDRHRNHLSEGAKIREYERHELGRQFRIFARKAAKVAIEEYRHELDDYIPGKLKERDIVSWVTLTWQLCWRI